MPANADGVFYQHNDAVPKAENTAFQQVFQDFHRLNKKNKDEGKPILSVGSVHAYVLSSDGKPFDSLHVAEAGPEHVIAMLEKAIKTFAVPKGKPLVTPSPLSVAPKANADDVVLHLTSRYLVAKGQPNARQDVDDELVPIKAALGGERSGQWTALPSEDWIVLSKSQWRKLLLDRPAKAGASWDVDKDVATQILTRVYPTTENNDLSTNRLDAQSLKGTVVSIKDGVVRARLEGTLKMKHAFYPRREDNKMVEATLVGYVEFDAAASRIRDLRLVTDRATYGGPKQYFGAAVRLVPARPE